MKAYTKINKISDLSLDVTLDILEEEKNKLLFNIEDNVFTFFSILYENIKKESKREYKNLTFIYKWFTSETLIMSKHISDHNLTFNHTDVLEPYDQVVSVVEYLFNNQHSEFIVDIIDVKLLNRTYSKLEHINNNIMLLYLFKELKDDGVDFIDFETFKKVQMIIDEYVDE